MHRVRTVVTGVAGAPWYSNIYFSDEGNRSAQDAATAVRQFWNEMANALATGLTFDVEDEVATVNEIDGEILGYSSTSTASLVASGTGEMLPAATQGLITLRTGGVRNSRRVQGRIFVPGLVESQNGAGGVPGAGAVTLLQIAANTLTDDLPVVQPVVWARPKQILGVTLPGESYPVTSAVARPFWAVLRSRRD